MLTAKQVREMRDGSMTAKLYWDEQIELCPISQHDIVEFTYGDDEVRRLLVSSVFISQSEKLCIKGLRLKGNELQTGYRCYDYAKMNNVKIFMEVGGEYQVHEDTIVIE